MHDFIGVLLKWQIGRCERVSDFQGSRGKEGQRVVMENKRISPGEFAVVLFCLWTVMVPTLFSVSDQCHRTQYTQALTHREVHVEL